MKLITNFALLVVSLLLLIILGMQGIIFEMVSWFRYGSFYRRINYYFLNTATAVDIFCNTAFKSMLDAYFLRKGGYHFGKRGETVSSVLGKNLYLGTLTTLGVGLAGVLGVLQKDHVVISVDDKAFELLPPPAAIKADVKIISFIIFALILYGSYFILSLII